MYSEEIQKITTILKKYSMNTIEYFFPLYLISAKHFLFSYSEDEEYKELQEFSLKISTKPALLREKFKVTPLQQSSPSNTLKEDEYKIIYSYYSRKNFFFENYKVFANALNSINAQDLLTINFLIDKILGEVYKCEFELEFNSYDEDESAFSKYSEYSKDRYSNDKPFFVCFDALLYAISEMPIVKATESILPEPIELLMGIIAEEIGTRNDAFIYIPFSKAGTFVNLNYGGYQSFKQNSLSEILSKVMKNGESNKAKLEAAKLKGDLSLEEEVKILTSKEIESFPVLNRKTFWNEQNDAFSILGQLRDFSYSLATTDTLSSFHFNYTFSDNGFSNYSTIKKWNPSRLKMDLVISDIPTGKLPKTINSKYGKISTYTEYALAKSIDTLKANGKAVLAISEDFLFRINKSSSGLRKYLVDNNLVSLLIDIPYNEYYSDKKIIIVLDKNKQNEEVLFGNTSEYLKKYKSHVDEPRTSYFNESASYLVNVLIGNDKIKIGVKNADIINNNYDLNVKLYQRKDINSVLLRNVLLSVHNSYKTIASDLDKEAYEDLFEFFPRKYDKFNYTFKNDPLGIHNLEEDNEIEVLVIEEDFLFLFPAAEDTKLTPIYCEYLGNPFVITFGLENLFFKVNESVIRIDYLIHEMYEEYFQKQIEYYFENEDVDLLDMVINLPSLSEQQKIVEGDKQINRLEKRIESISKAIKEGKDEKDWNEFASLKHSMGTPRQNLTSSLSTLKRFFGSNDTAIQSVNEMFQKRYEQDLSATLIEMSWAVNQITNLLERGEKEINLDDFTLNNIKLNEVVALIESYNSNNYNFLVVKDIDSCIEKEGYFIRTNLDLLKILIDNILSNANKHGFKVPDKNNKVCFSLCLDNYDIKLTVKNNGAPFPKGFTKEMFFEKYKTSNKEIGTGIGGYDIKRIADFLFNDYEGWILNLDEEEYPVSYSFIFDIIGNLK
jgi:type I restriction enzyme M protein